MASKITVELEAHSAGWTNGLARADGDLKKFVQSAKSIGSAFKGGNVNTVQLAGGVAAAGAVLNQVAQSAEKVATAIRSGKDATEVFHAAVDDIPIVGQFAQAGSAIYELVTGEKAAAEHMQKLTENTRETVTALRQAAETQAQLGKYGFNAQHAKEDAGYADQRAQLSDKIQDEKMAISKYNEQIWGDKEAYEKAKSGLTADTAKRQALDAQHAQNVKDIAREQEHTLHTSEVQTDLASKMAQHEAKERQLRQSGNTEDAEKERAQAAYEQSMARVADMRSEYNLSQYDDAGKARQLADAQKLEDTATKTRDDEVADAETRKQNRLANSETEHQENLRKIKSEAAANNLEALGATLPAEMSRLDEAYKEELDAARKRYAEEHNIRQSDVKDADIAADIKEATAKRDSAKQLAINKARTEAQTKLQDKAAEETKELTKMAETPLDKFRSEMTRIDEALNKGEISQTTYDRLRNQARGEFAKTAGETHNANYASFTGEGRASRLPPTQPNTVDNALLKLAEQQAKAQADMQDKVFKLWQSVTGWLGTTGTGNGNTVELNIDTYAGT